MAGYDAAFLSLRLIARLHQIDIDIGMLRHKLGIGALRSTYKDLEKAAAIYGLKIKTVRVDPSRDLPSLPRPVILRMRDGTYYVLNKVSRTGFDTLQDPLEVHPRVVGRSELIEDWGGDAILVAKKGSAESESEAAFGFRWFLNAGMRYRRPLIHVLICSLFVQLFALATPLLFQVVMDRVLVHKSISTLEVVAIALILIGLFDVGLQYLRSYALYHTASRIDVQLGSQTFNRLFALPASYFETRPTGQTIARVREIETIRSFLTGQGVTSIVDTIFTVLFFGVLFLYSASLTLVVLAGVPLYLLAGLLIRPPLRDKIRQRFNRSAISQQYLVESVVGAQTLKAAAIEPLLQLQWEERLAAYVKTSFDAVMIATSGQLVVQYITKLLTAAILFFGAKAVIEGDLTVGQLVAFNMISSQIAAPVMRLSQLWQDVQQAKVSIERLGDIFNSEPEDTPQRAAAAPIREVKGAISFKNITFRYKTQARPVLETFSLDIPVGQSLGIVGPSGSGKSTIAKLIQGMFIPESGSIHLDGKDISSLPTFCFRKQIGVVLQDNILFNRTVHENIALAVPGLSRNAVTAVARLSGADEFIQRLPSGYDTVIEERGANLSGGQRQRIAIARALAHNPRILILDEATSALDYESEQLLQQSMRRIVQGRTVIVIAHRLAAVRDCDRIISLCGGKIIEDGSHRDLLVRQDGWYRHLWNLQSTGMHDPLGAEVA